MSADHGCLLCALYTEKNHSNTLQESKKESKVEGRASMLCARVAHKYNKSKVWLGRDLNSGTSEFLPLCQPKGFNKS